MDVARVSVLVSAEVDSMGGVVDGGVGIGIKTSPRLAVVERAQAELRQEYDVREVRKRELEFLEKGGNPLDFKFGTAASISVQSTSLTDQHQENFVTSAAKESFALAASPHGDSVESNGRPGDPTICEPNSADNLLLFDGQKKLLEGKKNTIHAGRRTTIAKSEYSSQKDRSQHMKDAEDSAIFRPYARRNRSRSNARSSSTSINQSHVGHGSSLHICGGSRDVKGPVSEINNLSDQNTPSVSKPKFSSSNGDVVSKIVTSDDCKLDGEGSQGLTKGLTEGSLPDGRMDITVSKYIMDNVVCTRNSDQLANQSMDFVGHGIVRGREEGNPPAPEFTRHSALIKPDNGSDSVQLNGLTDLKTGRKISLDEAQNGSVTIGIKGLESDCSCTQTSIELDANNGSDVCTKARSIDLNGNHIDQISTFGGTPNIAGSVMVKENNETEGLTYDGYITDSNLAHQNLTDNNSIVKAGEEIVTSSHCLKNKVQHTSNVEESEQQCHLVSQIDIKEGNLFDVNSNPGNEDIFLGRSQDYLSDCEVSKTSLTWRDSACAPDLELCSDSQKLAQKACEDSILEEARIIESKQKRIADLSVGTLQLENHNKSHWDFVLEEMVWLVNDFTEERLWKMTAASQVGRWVASTSRLRFQEQNKQGKLKKVAYTLAKAVMQFWHSVEMAKKECNEQNMGRRLALQGYALRFMKYDGFNALSLEACEHSMTREDTSDTGIGEMLWEDHLSEESLFYTVPPGAMETYRKSIEYHLVQCERTGSIEEVETSIYDDPADFGYQDAYDEDEGDGSACCLPGVFEASKSSKFPQKKRKNLMKSYGARPCDLGADSPYEYCGTETKQHTLMGKRHPNNLNVGTIPTKRIRTASRQRVLSPFSAGAAGRLHVTSKATSSGDTNSFQDDQCSLQSGSQLQKGMEVDYFDDYENNLPYDCAETSTRPKKKKAKHLGWQVDLTVRNDQSDHSRKRMESHGLYAKRPKILNQQLDNTFDNRVSGSVPSPGASQISSMSNPSKFIKYGRDRGRKAKVIKMPAGQRGPGSPWSTFEDQALVVLVHDMGPNWELVSDAIDSTVQFKCIYRKPKECKDRHKILMDSAGDGADSAEDSGSSQSYPSTLPGIPKGSARQLFQHLQGPMQEDSLKSHFERIVIVGQKQHYWRRQNNAQNVKQRAVVHNSHVIALSQVYPNNLNGGVLTPLDLVDTSEPSPDPLSLGFQGSHTSVASNQAAVLSVLPTSSSNSSLQGSPPGPFSASVRDSRYSVQRTSSLPSVEQQRVQQLNQTSSGRSIQHPGMSVPGSLSGTDRAVSILHGGNGMVNGMSRSMQLPRSTFQGMTSPSMSNPGSTTSSSVGMPSPGHRNSVSRPREGLNGMQAGHNPDNRRQTVISELQMQGTQANSQGIPQFNGLTSAFCNQTSQTIQTYQGHAQQQHPVSPRQSHVLGSPCPQGTNHAVGPQQQAYAIRVAKERQMQQRYLQHQQIVASNTLMPQVQPQPQLPIPSQQNNMQIQSQTPALPPPPSSSMAPISSQHQHKIQLTPQGSSRKTQTGPCALANQMVKIRQQQQQQFQHSGRQQLQRQQHTQQAKFFKGAESITTSQNLSTDIPQLNGFSVPPVNQAADKGEQLTHSLQSQSLNSGPTPKLIQPPKPSTTQISNELHLQQKVYSGPTQSSSKQKKQHQPMSSHSDNGILGQVQPASSVHTNSASHQAVQPVATASNHQQPQQRPLLHQKLVNQNHVAGQRVNPQNRQLNSVAANKSLADHAQGERQSITSVSRGPTSEISQTCIESANIVPVVSSALPPHSTASESVNDTGMQLLSPRVGSIARSPFANSVGTEQIPFISQELRQVQSFGSLPPHIANVGVQWQQPHQNPKPPPPRQQQCYQPQEQLTLQQEQQKSPQQMLKLQQSQHHIHSRQENLYITPTNPKME